MINLCMMSPCRICQYGSPLIGQGWLALMGQRMPVSMILPICPACRTWLLCVHRMRLNSSIWWQPLRLMMMGRVRFAIRVARGLAVRSLTRQRCLKLVRGGFCVKGMMLRSCHWEPALGRQVKRPISLMAMAFRLPLLMRDLPSRLIWI